MFLGKMSGDRDIDSFFLYLSLRSAQRSLPGWQGTGVAGYEGTVRFRGIALPIFRRTLLALRVELRGARI